VATRTDAKNQQMQYSYDTYKRVTQMRRYSSGGVEDICQRVNFYYDSNPFDGPFSQNVWGRLAAAEWYQPQTGGCVVGSPRYTEWYSYTAAGKMTKKRFSITTGTYLQTDASYNNEGQLSQVKYPDSYVSSLPNPGTPVWTTGETYQYSFDSLGRPSQLTRVSPSLIVAKDATYNAAGQMTALKYWYGNVSGTPQYYSETRSYNTRLQLTNITAGFPGNLTQEQVNLTYTYPATQNNGQISSMTDAISGETINYLYDSLNRLTSAATTGPQWGLSFSYDGFGNRLSQTLTKGSGPVSSLAISLANNRITTSGYGYDSNGNLTTRPGETLTYDNDNRLTQASGGYGTEKYSYTPPNQRVWRKLANGTEEYYFYGVGGDRLGTYVLYGGLFKVTSANLQFAGKLIRQKLTAASGALTEAAVVLDRLGGVRVRSNYLTAPDQTLQSSRFFPYGEEIAATPNDRDKFATYLRDSSTGLDYAMNRYYGSNMGRFLTPDPFSPSANLGNPQSWNHYSYAGNDSVNKNDALGLYPDPAEPGDWFDDWPTAPRNPDAPWPCSPYAGCGYDSWYSPSPIGSSPVFRGDPGNGGGPGLAETPWEVLMKRLRDARDILNKKGYSEDCDSTISKLSGATMANGQKAGTISLATVLTQMNSTFGSINDGSGTRYWTLFPEGTIARNQARFSAGTRGWTVADAMSFRGSPAMAQIGGNGVYFSAALHSTLSIQDLAGSLLHEATHNLGFSEGQLNTLGAGLSQILENCVKK